MMDNCEFSLKHYAETLKSYKDEGYTFKTFKNYVPTETKQIVLRHDVDVSLEYALTIAQVEKQLGIKSTFFVLMSSDFYNSLDERNIQILKTISEYHDIGIHYDSSLVPENKYSGSRFVMLQAELLEKIIGYNVKISCEHNPIMGSEPSREMIGKLRHDYGIDNANLIENIKYISDSGKNWREGCFCQHIGKHDNLQINMHPIVWCIKSVNFDDLYDTFNEFLKQKFKFLTEQYKEKRRNYIERIKT